ncbi:MAG: NAD(P)H-binding protein [Gemmatimonadaceae bacterium]|nr:NAD(P)H-binding protein [Gemmatimonadaceae bacterium]
MSTILVVGANGTVGSALAAQLEAAGHQVRRGTSQVAGAGQVQLDLVSGNGLAEAVAGADAVFLMAPPGYVPQDTLLVPVIDAARGAGVKKVVLMTAMGADADPTSPLRRAELHLEVSGIAWNVIRPNWFMQNFRTFWLHDILTQGAVRLPTGQGKGSFIDARDIADVAAVLLTSDSYVNQAFNLTGDEALDHDEVVVLLSNASGTSIRYEDITPDAMRAGLLAAGLPVGYADFLVMILGYFKLGYSAAVSPAVQQITGHAPRRFVDFANEFATTWQRDTADVG